jgi:hypothetical protein
MCLNLRTTAAWYRASLLLTVVLAVSPLVQAQKVSKLRSDAALFETFPQRETPRPPDGSTQEREALAQQLAKPDISRQQREAIERRLRELAASDAMADRDAQPFDRELNEEIIRTRRDLMRQAVNRMRQGNSSEWLVRESIPLMVFLAVLGAFLWILNAALENRKWYRMVKVQSETHTKLLEKFGSSQEMLAYMESEAGRRFLEQPLFNIEQKQVARFPFGRILWSVQIGLIVGILGAGLLFLKGRADASPEANTALQVFGTLALTLGVGFVLSAIVSYFLSKRLGLFEGSKASLSKSEPDASRG